MANNFTAVGSEFQVNIPINNDQVDPEIAVMTDGRFAVVYEDEFSATADVNIVLQFINPNGIALDSSGNVFVADGGNHGIRIHELAVGGDQGNPIMGAGARGGGVLRERGWEG